MAVSTVTFEGIPGGMNVSEPSNEIADMECRYAVNCLFDKPGVWRRRGPQARAQNAAGSTVTAGPTTGSNARIHAIMACLDPTGTWQAALLAQASATGTGVYPLITSYTALPGTRATWRNYSMPSNRLLVDAKASIGGGIILGSSDTYRIGSAQGQGAWRGAAGSVSAGDISIASVTATRGSASVTRASGSFVTDGVVPGMFLMGTPALVNLAADTSVTPGVAATVANQLFGVVKTVSALTVTLEAPSLHSTAATTNSKTPAAGTVVFRTVRGLCQRVGKGRINISSGTATVNGSYTKFLGQKVGDNSAALTTIGGIASSYKTTATWFLYRISQLGTSGTVAPQFIGQVASVQSETQLTLSANWTGDDISNEAFMLVRVDSSADYDVTQPYWGFLTASFSGRQFYANLGVQSPSGADQTGRIYYSDPTDPEMVDTAELDGDYLEIVGSLDADPSIRGLFGTENALLIFKRGETWGLFGNSPTQWQLRKLSDDGILAPMCAQPYEGGVIWAGFQGIYLWDGVQVRNLSQTKLGTWWADRTRNLDTNTYRAWGMVVRNHYFVYLENLGADPTFPRANVAAGGDWTLQDLTVCINLQTGAFSLMDNLPVLGFTPTPAGSAYDSDGWYVSDAFSGSSAYAPQLLQASNIFADSGSAEAPRQGSPVRASTQTTTHPLFYVETKRHSVGDAQRKKLWKQIQLLYLLTAATGTGNLYIDTVPGLNDTGIATTSPFTETASSDTWVDRRMKFLKRDRHFAVRLYTLDANATRLWLGPWALGFKLQRVGRT